MSLQIDAIIKELTKKIKDDNFIIHFGTSIEMSMGHQYEEKLKAEYIKLTKQLQKYSLSNDILDEHGLKNFLENLAKENNYNTFITDKHLNSVYQLLDLNNEDVSIQDFVTAYLLIQEKLNLKRIKNEKAIESCENTKTSILKEIENHKNEKLNKNGVSDKSSFKIKIVSASLNSEYFGFQLSSYAYLGIENNKEYNTNLKENTNDPIWNETFEFMLNSIDTSINIRVQNGKIEYGQVNIPIREFQSQNLKEESYFLINNKGEKVGKVLINAHLIWSNYTYNRIRLERYKSRITQLNSEKVIIDKYYSKIQVPFGLLISEDIDEIIYNKITELDNDGFTGRSSILPTNRLSVLPSRSRQNIEEKVLCK